MKGCDCRAHNGFLTVRGYAENAQREDALPRVDDMDMFEYLDCSVSVSGLRRDEDFLVFDDQVIDQQYRRFHNGW